MMETSATITFARPFGLTGAIRKFHIICDGAKVGKISNESSETVTLAPGKHAVQVKSDWLGADPLIVTLGPGEHLRLICASADDILQATLATFFLPNRYLQLREMAESEELPGAQNPGAGLSPSWKKVGLYCVGWLGIVASFTTIQVSCILHTPGPEQVQDARFETAGQVAGFLLGCGWCLIVVVAYLKRRSVASRR